MHVILAAGGTGGHLFPALALGQAFQRFNHQITYVGSGRPMDLHAEELSGMNWKHLKAGRLKGMGWIAMLKSLFAMPLALMQALFIIIQEKPDLVLGLGGYSTGPMVLIARIVGIYTAILEQNRIPGFTNRILIWCANRVFIAFPLVQNYWNDNRKVIVTGNPIRNEVIQQFQQTQHRTDRMTLLIFGGSQGAHFLNQVMLRLLPRLQKRANELAVIHITGEFEHKNIQAAYKDYPEIDAQVIPFSDQIGALYKQANFVLSRAGASTISDLIDFGRAAVLIPYPFAADGHQHANGQYLVDAGAAIMIDQDEFNIDSFWKDVELWLQDPGLLRDMATRAHALAPHEAPAERIIRECQNLVGVN